MTLSKRRDGSPVPDIPAVRRLEPYLMPTRIESMVYYPQRIEVETLLEWLNRVNAGRPSAERITFFQTFITAFARLYRLRPELNRFIAGRRMYAHRDIIFSFTVRKAMTEGAPETQARMVFTGRETVDEVRDRVTRELARARGSDTSAGDRLIKAVVTLPRPVKAATARVIWALDHLNVLPASLQEAIPVYASAYLVNLGSLGAAAPFHHLYQRGTASVFAAIGAIGKEPVVDDDDRIVARRCVQINYSIDERATDGYYFVQSAKVLESMLTEPDQLLEPLRRRMD